LIEIIEIIIVITSHVPHHINEDALYISSTNISSLGEDNLGNTYVALDVQSTILLHGSVNCA
jgi:hypothetical protein